MRLSQLTARRSIVLFIASITVAFLASCAERQEDRPSNSTASGVEVTVDSSVQPDTRQVQGIDGSGPRTVGAISDGSTTGDLVEHEMLVAAPDRSEAEATAERWNGSVIERITPEPSAVETVPSEHVFLIRIGDVQVGGQELEVAISERSEHIEMTLTGSSRAVLETLAAASIESRKHGPRAAPNWVMKSAGFGNERTLESKNGDKINSTPYTRNSASWPYIAEEATQSTGLEKAWKVIEAMGPRAEQVPMVIIDGGFLQSDDFPASTTMVPEDGWNTPNPKSCTGGGFCPWHGTRVASAAFGQANDGYGTAGAAGQVADPMLLQAPASDAGAIWDFVFESIPEAISTTSGESNAIMNMSGAKSFPGAVCLTGVCKMLGKLSDYAQDLGFLIFASAGNNGANVDSEKCAGPFEKVCWENTKYIPCELSGVVCVGGLMWDGLTRHEDSNYGTDGAVDIYASYTLWTADVPWSTEGASVSDRAQKRGGTSFSSPFVAGIAALVWSVAPEMSPGELQDWMLDEGARNLATWTFPPRVDAKSAVLEAARGDIPPLARIEKPASGERFTRLLDPVRLESAVDDLDSSELEFVWKSSLDGVISKRPSVRTRRLSAGLHNITLEVTDEDGHVDRESVLIKIDSAPPLARIIPPESGSSVPKGAAISLRAETLNPDEPWEPLAEEDIRWTVDGSSKPFASPDGESVLLRTGSLPKGRRTVKLTTYRPDGSRIAIDSIAIRVTDPPTKNLEPTVHIDKPSGSGTEYPANNYDKKGAYALVELCAYGFDESAGRIEGSDVDWWRRVEDGKWSSSSFPYTKIGSDPGPKGCLKHKFYREGEAPKEYELLVRVTDPDGAVGSATTTINVTAHVY